MNYVLIPDLAAMAALIAIFMVLRRRHAGNTVNYWLLGLGFIFLEGLAHLLYTHTPRLPRLQIDLLHVAALDSYIIAGLAFVSAADHGIFRQRNRKLYLALNALPLLGLQTFYGLGLTDSRLFLACAIAGLTLGIISTLTTRRTPLLLLAYFIGWLPVLGFVLFSSLRAATYWNLAMLYLLSGIIFYRSLPPKTIGRIIIFLGFLASTSTFLSHPWAAAYPIWDDVNEQIWNMQKFLIAIGMVISMLEEQVNSNEWMALHDQLTGLPNRRLFYERLAEALSHSEQAQTSAALIMIDLNGFKAINDSYGHAAGDELLRSIGQNLATIVTPADTLARIGGDEFVLLATNLTSNAPDSLEITSRIAAMQTAFDRPFPIHGIEIPVSASFGVAIAPKDANTPDLLQQIADSRMYQRKNQARRA